MKALIVDERFPKLPARRAATHGAYVPLDGRLRAANTEFEQLSPDSLSAPEFVVARHLPNQRNGSLGNARFAILGSRFSFPKQPKPFAMPPKNSVWLNQEYGTGLGFGTAGEQHQTHAVAGGESRLADLAAQQDDLLS